MFFKPVRRARSGYERDLSASVGFRIRFVGPREVPLCSSLGVFGGACRYRHRCADCFELTDRAARGESIDYEPERYSSGMANASCVNC